MRLSSSISAATAGPTRRNSGTSSGSAKGNPRRPMGTPKRAVSAASRISHSEAISSPPPTQTPSIAAISGTGHRSIAVSALPIVSRWYLRPLDGSWRTRSNSSMSAPAAKLPPAPRITTTRSSSASPMSSKTRAKPCHIATLTAFSLPGESSVTAAMPPSIETSTLPVICVNRVWRRTPALPLPSV